MFHDVNHPKRPDGLGVAPRQRRADDAPGWTIGWNGALDIWLLAEFVALATTLGLFALVFKAARAMPAEALLPAAMTWVTAFGAVSWLRRARSTTATRTDALTDRLVDWSKATALAILFAFLMGQTAELPRAWAITSFIMGGAVILLIGVAAKAAMFVLAERGALGERIAIYGCGDGTGALLKAIEARAGPTVRIDGLFDERAGRGTETLPDHIIGRDVEQLIAQAKAGRISAVMLNLPWSAKTRIDDLVRRLEQVNIDIIMAPAEIQMDARIGHIGAMPAITLYRRPHTGLQAVGKVILDRGAAALALLVLSLPLLAVALAIKLDSPGPVLFRQKRRGMNNESFDVFKFRSMRTDKADANADKLVTKGDARVTRIGAFIRRTSIDELPQLFNVLLGQMSLVGPRPHAYGAKAADKLYEEVVGRYPARHRVLPGITGLAQVRGYRGNTTVEADIINRVESDLEYIDRWTIGLDISILLRTAATFLFQRGAY